MYIHPPPADTFVAVYWTRDDLLGALARRVVEFEDDDRLYRTEEPLTAASVGVTESQLEDLERSVTNVLENMSIECGWEVIEEFLDWHLGSVFESRERGEHPNAPRRG